MKYKKTIDLYGDGIGKVQYIQHTGSDKMIVNAARVSFGQDSNSPINDKDEKLINYLIKHRHTSPFEHNQVTLKFVVPLFVRSQHHRHRVWAYNEISRRYTDTNIQFYEPTQFRTQHKSNRQASSQEELSDPLITFGTDDWGWSGEASGLVKKHHKGSVELYEALLRSGVCREQARGILPQNLYTEYYGSANLSNLFKFINLRTHSGAQQEIQVVAQACLEIATDLFPVSTTAWKKHNQRA